MSQAAISLLLLILGGTCGLAAFLGHRMSNAGRDVALMAGTGAGLAVAALVAYVV